MATDSQKHIGSTASSSTLASKYSYPFAAAPDIIRSHQKDIYFQNILFEQLSTILRKLYGSRFIHTYNSEAHTFTELLYLGLTTLVGNRTLGEEYCDIIQISDDSLQLPAFFRRYGYIMSAVIVPYVLNRFLPAFRARVRLKLEADLRRKSKSLSSNSQRLKAYILENLSALTSPSPVHALTLSVFYFTGSYYHLGKRLFGLRYIFPKTPAPSDQRVGYEVLGVLLVLQMAMQGWSYFQDAFSPPMPFAVTAEKALDDSIETVDKEHQSRLEKTTHTSLPDGKPRYDLKDAETMGWIPGPQQRKCTLCLEPMKDPSVTTCGHVFCWTCILDWIREKPECPLCRQEVLGQHVLPLRG